ncbi:MAG: hypothetical protein PHT50_05015 [Candidatus Omnitrophica bacterium]|nr:hypothetical protein [Candidatus Omnitrophota bacterium]
MFGNNNRKQEKSMKEVIKMKNLLICCIVFVVVVFCVTNAWAAASQTVSVNATVPTMAGGLSVTVSKVVGSVWTTASSISFGTLIWDNTNKIFLPNCYYAVDIGVTDNSGTVWTLTHTRVNLAGQGTNLNGKVNVSFNKQTSSSVGTELAKYSYANSQNIAYTKTQLSGGWLRIYYGVGTGEAGKDATGVTPIGLDTPAGTYTGSVTITLTP